MTAMNEYGSFSATLIDQIMEPPGANGFEQRYRENGPLIAKGLWISFALCLAFLLAYPYLSKILVWGFKFKEFLGLAKSLGNLFSSLVATVVLFTPLAQGIIMIFPVKLNTRGAWIVAVLTWLFCFLLIGFGTIFGIEMGTAVKYSAVLALCGLPMIALGPVVTLYRHKGIGKAMLGLAFAHERTIDRLSNEICRVHADKIPGWKSQMSELTAWFVTVTSKPKLDIITWLWFASLGLTIFFALEDRTFVYAQILWLNKVVGYLFIQTTILAPYLSLALNNTDRALDRIFCKVMVQVMGTDVPDKSKAKPLAPKSKSWV